MKASLRLDIATRSKPAIVAACLAWILYFVATIPCSSQEPIVFSLPHYKDFIVVPVTVMGEEHLFVVDSGATTHLFDSTLRPKLGESIGDCHVRSAHDDRIKAELFRLPETRFGSMELFSPPVACLDLSALQEFLGRDIKGVLGMPLFRTHVVQIDFAGRAFSILPTTQKPTELFGRHLELAEDDAWLPTIDIELPGNRLESCTLDTGANCTIGLRSEVYTALLRKGEITPLENTQAVSFTGHIEEQRSGRLSEVQWAGFTHKNLIVADSGRDSRIGISFLRRHVVTIDLGQSIFVAASSEFDEKDRESVGAGLRRRNGKTDVVFIRRNSPAEQAGLLVDDAILTLAGKDITGLPLPEIYWMLREATNCDGVTPIRVRRGDEEHSLNLIAQEQESGT